MLELHAHQAMGDAKKVRVSTSSAALCYSISLAFEPRAAVRVSIECRSSQVMTRPVLLVFGSSDWFQPKVVFVEARPGTWPTNHEEGPALLEHVVRSPDARFNDRVRWLEAEYVPTLCPSVLSCSAGEMISYGQVAPPWHDDQTLDILKKVAAARLAKARNVEARGERRGQVDRLLGDHAQRDFFRLSKSDDDATESGLKRATREAVAASIVAAAAGESHSVVLSATGLVFASGANECGQLGVGDRVDRALLTPVSAAEKAAGPRPRFSQRLLVSRIACGSHHTAAITLEGQLYAWGSNKFGQLGAGDGDAAKPRRVALPREVLTVSRIACGGEHTLCTAIGAHTEACVFAWGNARAGALGLARRDHKIVRTPRKVESLRGVLDVACGTLHSACVDERGRVFTCGANEFFQLGRARGPRDEFSRIELDGVASQVACGGSHTLVLLSTGAVYACGDNSYGQLGLGDFRERKLATRLESLDGIVANRLVAGPKTSAALTRCGRVYLWGQHYSEQLSDDADAPWLSSCSTPAHAHGAAVGNDAAADELPVPSLALTPSCCVTRAIALGCSHTLLLTDQTRDEATRRFRRALRFALDAKAHFRQAKALLDPRKESADILNHSWMKACKLHEFYHQLCGDQLTEARAHRRAVAAIERARLDRILKRRVTGKSHDLFQPTWCDRVAVALLLQTRLARAAYDGRRYREGDRAELAETALRLETRRVLTFLGLRAALTLRAASTLHRCALDLELIAHVEGLLRRRRASSGPFVLQSLLSVHLQTESRDTTVRCLESPAPAEIPLEADDDSRRVAPFEATPPELTAKQVQQRVPDATRPTSRPVVPSRNVFWCSQKGLVVPAAVHAAKKRQAVARTLRPSEKRRREALRAARARQFARWLEIAKVDVRRPPPALRAAHHRTQRVLVAFPS